MTEPNPIQTILIAGGGSSGWMSAAYLARALSLPEKKETRIILVESSDIPTIGVGEATIPIFQDFFNYLDIPEDEWMEKCRATFKLAIRFDRWLDGSERDSYWHTFGTVPFNRSGHISPLQHWLLHKVKGSAPPFAVACHESALLCEAGRAPKSAYEAAQHPIPYAYHLDAGLLAETLKEYAKSKGVEHYVDFIDKVNKNEAGYLTSIQTAKNGEIKADFFIDCTGFQSLLIEKALEEKWESYQENLFCDRAVAIGIPYADGDEYNEQHGGLNPFTTATALQSGWIWHTPLRSRDGNGYVYSSAFKTEDEAEQEMRQHLGPRAANSPARHLKMRIGKMDRLWVKNCVAIGLAGGFIEPLESTGLALIQIGLATLVQNFPDKHFSEALQRNYNRILKEQYENIRDFIVLHYCLTQREDTSFWKAVKNETKIPDNLQAQLDEWKYLWPNDSKGSGRMFGPFNHASILAGMNYLPEYFPASLEFLNDPIAQKHFERVESRGKQLAQTLPDQAEYFRQLERIKAFKADDSW